MPSVSQRDMNISLGQHSKNHKADFNVSWALYELYTHHVALCYDSVGSASYYYFDRPDRSTSSIRSTNLGDALYTDLLMTFHGFNSNFAGSLIFIDLRRFWTLL